MILWLSIVFVTVIQKQSSRSFSVQEAFLKISQNSQENTCDRVFIKKEALAQVFSCESRGIFKNTFFIEHLGWLLLANGRLDQYFK